MKEAPVKFQKKGKGTKCTHSLGSLAGVSKIPKNIKIAHGNGSKFK